MAIFNNQVYRQALAECLAKGEAVVIIKCDPFFFPQVKTFFKNRKARDKKNKSKLDRLEFLEIPQDKVLQVSLFASTEYLLDNDLFDSPDIQVLNFNIGDD